MKLRFFFFLFLTQLQFIVVAQKKNIKIVVHGGAGALTPENLSPERQAAYKEELAKAINVGYYVLRYGGTALDAVQTVVLLLEDSPLFNAGKGSVFTAEGTNEMDASIMDGQTLNAGAVAGVKTIKNPIKAARAVMEKSQHVMLIGEGADKFAKEQGLEIVDSAYFFDEYRYQQFQKNNKLKLDHSDDKGEAPTTIENFKHGTVGAVALDKYGNLAAATSTGGMTNKRFGRIGDSAVIGAGTYADNNSCAISCTGHGEYFIRTVAAHAVANLVTLKNYSIEEAGKEVLEKIKSLGGDGGMIILDSAGNFAMPFNTPGMIRGYMNEQGQPVVEIF